MAGHPAKAKLEFFGKALFIPSSFVVTGFLIAPIAFAHTTLDNFLLVAGILVTLISGKTVAAAVAGRAFSYARSARSTMWALTLPQVAATLAATLVGYDTLNAAGRDYWTKGCSMLCWCCWLPQRFWDPS